MRKLKLQMHISLDGFVATPNGEPSTSTTFTWDDGVSRYSIDNLKNVDCILLGRNTAEGFIPYWAEVASNPNESEHKLGRLFTDIPKVIFSNELSTSKWDNTTIVKGKIAEAIKILKNQEGKDIIVYGGVKFVSSLIEEGLVDEYHLLVNPIALGDGMPIFNGQTPLKLAASTAFECGIVVNQYQPIK